jgi:hypothetical protein
MRAFYVDEKGNRIKELPQVDIRFGTIGSKEEELKPKLHYAY